MAQPAQIGLEEGAQVGDAVFQHRHAVDAHAEGEALPLLGVEAHGLQHARVHHPAAQDLQPVAALADDQLVLGPAAADVDLGRGLGEREVAGAEAHRHVVALEVGAHEVDQAALEVAHVGAPVDQQALDLVEHRRVGGVAVAAVGAAGRDDPERRLARLHGADLHRAGVRAQQQWPAVALGLEVEGVEHLPGGVLGRDVERLEIVPVVLDVRAFGDREAHVGEDRHDLLGGLADRVDPPLLPLARRQGDVDPLRLELGVERRLPASTRAAGRPGPPRPRA